MDFGIFMEDQERLTLGGDASLSSSKIRQLSGAVLEGASRPYTRIDYPGHCGSALLTPPR